MTAPAAKRSKRLPPATEDAHLLARPGFGEATAAIAAALQRTEHAVRARRLTLAMEPPPAPTPAA